MLRPVWFILILFGLIYNTYSFNIVIMMFGFGAGFPGEWGDLMMTNIFRNSFQLWNFGTGRPALVRPADRHDPDRQCLVPLF